jgi:hypothetical protein
MRKISLIIAIFITFSVLLSACGNGKPAPEQSPLPTMSLTDITSQSNQAMALANSLQFELEHNKGFTYIAMDIQMEKLVADVLRPDRMKGLLSGTYSGAYFKNMELIIVGDTGYVKIFRWFPFETDVSPLGFLNTLSAILDNTTDMKILAAQKKDGVLCYHLNGEVNTKHLKAFVGDDVTQNVVSIELWIGGQDFLVRQVDISGKLTNREASGIIRSIKISNYGQQLTIEPPQIE